MSTALNPHPHFSAINISDEPAWSFQYGFARLARSYTDVHRNSGMKFLIYGKTGWIGGLLGKLCNEEGIAWEYGSGRLDDRISLLEDIRKARPTHVLSAAGVTGRPNVDWCESHKVETIRTNVVGTLNLADVCKEEGLYLMNFATGCIFEYDKEHPLGSGIGFKEEDKPNFIGSFYSKTKAMVINTSQSFISSCINYNGKNTFLFSNLMTIFNFVLKVSHIGQFCPLH